MPRPERIYDRRAVVKVSYKPNFTHGKSNGTLEEQARYMERGHEKETGHREVGYDATHDSVEVRDVAHNWALARDARHWRIILSPDDVERINLRQHVRDVMAQMEQDLGTKLAWVAVEHDNTDRYHAHILIRGVRLNEYDRDGKCLTLGMPRDYVSHGIREISQELIQRQLGPRSESEYLEVRGHGIEGERWTEIDRAIERKVQDGVADYRFAAWLNERSRPRVQQEMERLAYLEGRGLAQSLGDNRWLVNGDFKETLRELQLSKDVIKSHARVHAKQRDQERALA
jgi:type IV secretory pathway VirD2 relaxase